MVIKPLVNVIVIIFTLLLASHAHGFGTIDESATWATVAQGHHQYGNPDPLPCAGITSTQFTLNNSAKIRGTLGLPLAYCSSNDGSGLPTDSCDELDGTGRKCTTLGYDLIGLNLTGDNAFLTSSAAGGNINYCNTGDSLQLGQDGQSQFGNVSLYSACTLSMSASQSEYRFTSIAAGNNATLELTAGDYFIESLTLNSGSKVVLKGDVRLFIKNSSQFNSATVNTANLYQLQIVAYNNLQLTGTSDVTAYVYSNETLSLYSSSAIKGRISSRYLNMGDSASVTDSEPLGVSFHIQYGKSQATSGVASKNVVFDTPFTSGVKPLVFIMPTISDSDANNDSRQSAFLSSISETGFTWTRALSAGNSVATEMPEVHWIAVTPGTFDLSNGTQLIAGSVLQNKALIGSNNQYVDVTLPSTQNVVLNQLQTQNNNCWLTSTSQFTSNGIQLAMDASEVRNNSGQCEPGKLNNNSLQNEQIAYLAVKSGSGALVLDGNNVNYHFGLSQTFNSSGTTSVGNQCQYFTVLTGFTNIPTLVASKNSRRGGDGGWLRRCVLTSTNVSMVTDEDNFRDNDRNHVWENYSFVALEKLAPIRQCFTDEFERTELGTDWVAAKSAGTFTPSIVSGRLRQTEAKTNQATSTTYQRLFPGKNNKVEIEFDHYAYGGTGADGIAFVLSDASITPQPGAAGGPMGYGARSNVNGFAGGWLGFGIDEYGNFSAEGGPNGPGRRRQSVSIRGSGSGTSGYPYLRGTCSNGTTNTGGSCLSPTVDNNNVSPAHRYRITVDSQIANQSVVKVERDTGSGFVEIISAFDAAAISTQAAIPDNFLLSLTGSTGGATNNHEIDNVEICALQSEPIGIQIDHFEYSYSGQGVTCAPKTLSIKACANADCSLTVTDSVTATLSPAVVSGGGGWVGGNVVTFTGGQKSDLQLRSNTAGTVTLGVTGSVPSTTAFSQTLCRINGGAASAANCNLVFADSGFIFDVPDKLANKPSGNIAISAVKKSDETLQCIPTFANTTKNVSFWSTYLDPVTPINGQSVTVNNTVVGKQSSAATSIALAFDATGKANINVNYPDAGKMQLDAQYTGSGDEAGLIMLGSDPFVSFPVGLCVTPKDTAAQCSAGNSSCNRYKKAGESFDLVIQGKAWQADGDGNYCDNLNTPNYVHDNIALAHQLVSPSGGVLGSVGSSQYNHVAETTNSNTVSQSVSEVGVFTFSAKPPSSYLGSTFYDIPLALSPNIGRFVPDRFLVSSSSVLPSCGSFTYMDQPFGLTLTLDALNTGSYVTQNYQGSFAKASASLVAENANDGVELSHRLSALPVNASTWSLGQASVDVTYQALFSRTTSPGVDGPFGLLDVGVLVADNDGNVAFVASPDMRADSSDICTDTSTCNAKLLSTQDFRHGRVVMDNTFGPENEVLRMPTYAQYWSGSAWITNTNDSCTQVSDPLDGTEVYAPTLTAGQTITRTDNGSLVNNGLLTLLWQNTGSNAYRGQVTAPLQVDNWLQWYWNWDDASPTVLYDPRASAFFGRYRGHDRIIYWREVGQ